MADRHVSMSEVAQRLGLTLPAVSNWRRRHPSFPASVAVEGRELFSVAEVATWLDGRRIAKKDLKPDELPGTTYGTRFRDAVQAGRAPAAAISDDLWWQLAEFRGAEDVAVFADLVFGLLYLAVSNNRHWADIAAGGGLRRLQLVEFAALAHDPPLLDLQHAHRAFLDMRGETRLAGIVRVIERVRRSGRGAHVFEFLLDQFAYREGRRQAEVHTPAAVVRLLVELVGPAPGARVLDPCCGSGGFLLEAAKYVEAHGGRRHDFSLTGHALSERSAAVAWMNLRLHDVPAEVDGKARAIFDGPGEFHPQERFDVVLSNPPFDMLAPTWSEPVFHGRYGSLPKTRTSFAWLQHVSSSLADGGRAAVVMPGGTLFRGGVEQQVRANMVEDGIVAAIIALPARMFVSTGIPVTVWLLSQRAGGRAGELLFVDASHLGHMVSRTQRSLVDEDRSRIVDTVTRWRTGNEYEDAPGFSASVAVERIREQGYVLTPARYVGVDAEPDTPLGAVDELRDELARLELRAAKVTAVVERRLDGIRTWIR